MNKKFKIGIVGYGVVGKAIADYFKEFAEIFIFDPQYKKTSKKDIDNCDLAFICVPTARKKDDSCDISLVEENISWIKTPLIIIKSTIEPGTTDRLIEKYKKRIVFSPEYTSESKYFNPLMRSIADHPFIILGGAEKDCLEIQEVLSEISGPLVTIFTCKTKEAELIKYFENTFFAMKVGFSNEMREICEKTKVNYHKVRNGWLLDPRINRMHTLSFRDSRGYSGKCFPKDIAALNKWCEKELGYIPPIINSIKKWDLDNKLDK